jgi:hypothetical protein
MHATFKMLSVEFYRLFGRIYFLRLENRSLEKEGASVYLHCYLRPTS